MYNAYEKINKRISFVVATDYFKAAAMIGAFVPKVLFGINTALDAIYVYGLFHLYMCACCTIILYKAINDCNKFLHRKATIPNCASYIQPTQHAKL